jgi:acetolactate synthase-1/2/3 large subunit
MVTAAAAVVDLLAAAGVRHFFTVPGESFLELLDEVHRRPELVLVSCRHESGAAFMAEAVGKLTGRPAVVMATRAVGAANAAIGVHTARQDSTPMIVLLGQVETDRLGREAFQEVDLPRFYAELTVHAETVHRSDRAAEAVARAYRAATAGRPGPAMVAFPADVLAGPCELLPARAAQEAAGAGSTGPDLAGSGSARPGSDLAGWGSAGSGVPWLGGPIVPAAVGPDAATARAVAMLLCAATRPVMIAGRGAQLEPDAARRLAEHFGLGVYAAFRRQDAFPNNHPQYLGHLGIGAPPELLEPLQAADLVLALGCRLSEVTTQGYRLPLPAARLIQVDPAPSAVAAATIACTAGAFTAAMLAAGGDPVCRDWSTAHDNWLRLSAAPSPTAAAPVATSAGSAGPGPAPRPVTGGGASPVHPAEVIAAMRRRLPADAIMVNDAGDFAIYCHRHWPFDHPHTQLGPTSGAMGYAVPAAIGAQLAAPSRPVVALAGDGGFLMTGQELETAARHGLPILVVVFQNGRYGTIARHQSRRTGRPVAVDIGNADLAGFARALGAHATTVDRAADLDDALGGPFDRLRVVVVHTSEHGT